MLIGFGVVHHGRHQIVCIAAIFPEIQVAQRENPVWPQRPRNGVQARDEVNKQITGHARAVVFVVAPPEKPFGLKPVFRCVAEIGVPIHVFGVQVGRHRVLPRAEGIGAVEKTLHKGQFANIARPESFLGFQNSYTAGALTANFKHLS